MGHAGGGGEGSVLGGEAVVGRAAARNGGAAAARGGICAGKKKSGKMGTCTQRRTAQPQPRKARPPSNNSPEPSWSQKSRWKGGTDNVLSPCDVKFPL